MPKKKKFLIGGAFILLAVAYLMYTGFQSSAVYYLTVSEVKAQGLAESNTDLRVTGTVVDGSIHRVPGSLQVQFTIADAGGTLPVAYRGIVPDTFKEGSDVVVEGKCDPQGVFQARVLLAKCPSRYEPQA
ncbi:MAG: cytochrome c maturation protein CcmE [Chloroflexi bacterium]|nr:cytochrome c maturation protein CcmE [Chloroflexota bacterium]